MAVPFWFLPDNIQQFPIKSAIINHCDILIISIMLLFIVQISKVMQATRAKVRLLLTRHGETEQNIKGVLMGQSPGNLTHKGREQASQLGKHFSSTQPYFDQIYVSDLARTVTTFEDIKIEAEYLAKVPTEHTSMLRQRNGGQFEGLPHSAWQEEAERQGVSKREFRAQGAESWVDLNHRVRQFLKMVVEKHCKNQNNVQKGVSLLGVTHGGVLKEFHRIQSELMSEPELTQQLKCSNCSLHEFVLECHEPVKSQTLHNVKMLCIRTNDVSHLS